MNTIKAIQTRYAGCHFRSRLEARWAVFFDALGIRWEYEPEGFELPDGSMYLPDFFLPGISVWVEVKAKFNPVDAKWRQFHDLVNDPAWMGWGWADPLGRTFEPPTVERTFMVGQHPNPKANDFGLTEVERMMVALGPGSPHAGWAFVECPYCFGNGTGVERYDIGHVAFPSLLSCGHGVDPHDDCFHFMSPAILAAYTAARSARFEHGQSGAA